MEFLLGVNPRTNGKFVGQRVQGSSPWVRLPPGVLKKLAKQMDQAYGSIEVVKASSYPVELSVSIAKS